MPSRTRTLIDQVVADLDRLLCDDSLAGLPDAERVEVLQSAGAAFRRVEAAVVETIASADAVGFPHSTGCRTQNELLQRTLLTDVRGAARVEKVVGLVRRDVSLVSGDRLPARWPALREAMLDGVIGVAGLLAATEPIEKVSHRIGVDDRLDADSCLARAARGFRPDPDDPDREVQGPPPTLNELKILAEAMAALLDPDGDEPGDEPARRRGITLGRMRDGLRSIKGWLTPDVAAQLEAILDAVNNPKGDGPPMPGVAFTEAACGPAESGSTEGCARSAYAGGADAGGADVDLADAGSADAADADAGSADAGSADAADADTGSADAGSADAADAEMGDAVGRETVADESEEDPFNSDPRFVIDGRTAAQKRHDALAAALSIAARHRDMPTLGGSGPVLVVTVDANDLADGTGRASVSGAWGQLPVSVAAHVGCAGTVQRVLFDEGQIVGISTTDRVFTVHQRRAIVARDKECLIPGCHVPASWCEIHHVMEHARGGPTHTDNGVPLCWWHHRSLGSSGWEIRMDGGVPQVRGPIWWDPEQQWRTPRLSTPRLRASGRRRRRERGRRDPAVVPTG